MSNRILFVDPSSTSIGWAIFDYKCNLLNYGSIIPKGDGILEKMSDMMKSFDSINLKGINKVVIEINTLPYAKNIKRINLYQMFVGVTISYFLPKISVELIEAKKWKGNKSESEVSFYASKVYKPDTQNKDTLTAIWLGHYYININKYRR